MGLGPCRGALLTGATAAALGIALVASDVQVWAHAGGAGGLGKAAGGSVLLFIAYRRGRHLLDSYPRKPGELASSRRDAGDKQGV